MASSAAARLTEAHRLAQSRLGAQTARQVLSTWPLLDPNDLDGTAERWLEVTVPIVQRQRAVSARLASGYLLALRRLELGTTAGFAPVVVEQVPTKALLTSLLVTGPYAVKTAMRGIVARSGADDRMTVLTARAIEIGQTRSAGAAMRQVLNGGRETIVQSVAADEQAIGWQRVTSGKACEFCSMLAGRGAVYGADTVGFEAHDHCSCSAQPLYAPRAGK